MFFSIKPIKNHYLFQERRKNLINLFGQNMIPKKFHFFFMSIRGQSYVLFLKQYNVMDIRRQIRKKVRDVLLNQAYKEPPTTLMKKKKNLINLFKQNLIPKECHCFFIPLMGPTNSKNVNSDSKHICSSDYSDFFLYFQ